MLDVIDPTTAVSPNGVESPVAAPLMEAVQAPVVAEPVKVEEPKPAVKPEQKPIVYDLKMPEKTLLKPDALAKIQTYAKEKNLSNEQAQELVKLESEAVAGYHEQLKEDLKQKSGEWLEEIKLDNEIGGQNLTRNLDLAKRVVHKFGSESLIKTLDETGLGNNPELVRFVSRIGRAMGEDSLVMPSGNAPSGKKSIEELFYGKTAASS